MIDELAAASDLLEERGFLYAAELLRKQLPVSRGLEVDWNQPLRLSHQHHEKVVIYSVNENTTINIDDVPHGWWCEVQNMATSTSWLKIVDQYGQIVYLRPCEGARLTA